MKLNTKSDELDWSAITTMADGSQQTKWQGEPVRIYRLPIFPRSSIFYHTTTTVHPYLREARRMQAARERAVKKEERLEKERFDRIRHSFELQRADFRRRMINMILMEMANAIFEVAGGIVKKRELRMAFREFLMDFQYDDVFNHNENFEE